jgi:hypothetical protein
MILAHVWGLLSHPDREWEAIGAEPCSIGNCYLRHVLVLASLPAVSAFIGTTQFGWQIGVGEGIKLSVPSGMIIAAVFYVAMLVAVIMMGEFIHWMARTYGANPSIERCVVLSAYTATPLFLAGVLALYPLLWLNMLVGLLALAYTIYLLYVGVPIVMGIPKEQGYMFSSSILTVGMVMLVGLLSVTVILWGFGGGSILSP